MLASVAFGAEPGGVVGVADDLTGISLEALSEIEITSVARKPQSLMKAASAIYVVTSEDIRRTGVVNLPDALRLVPGLYVAQINANQWVVSARGFAQRYSSDLLVLIDGRTIYTPLFSGVFWEMHDIPVETIERIEVIRGPGATMWGTNAVNGVINVITKRPDDLQGGALTAAGGTLDGGLSSVRYGGAVGQGFYSVHGKYHQRASSPAAAGARPFSQDSWGSTRGGFRLLLPIGQSDEIEAEGGLQQAEGFNGALPSVEELVTSRQKDVSSESGFVRAQWRRVISERSDFSLQVNAGRSARKEPSLLNVRSSSVELTAQHRRQHGARGELTYGGGFRRVSSRMEFGSFLSSDRPDRALSYLNGFVQEEYQPIRDELFITAGAKLEENSLGGFAFQPTLRALWSPKDRFSVWGAASRATRSPYVLEQDVTFHQDLGVMDGFPVRLEILPNPEQRNVLVKAWEAGVRFRPLSRVSFDLAAFRMDYDHAASLTPETPFIEQDPVRVVFPVSFGNLSEIASDGAEGTVEWTARKDWRLIGTYSWIQTNLFGRQDLAELGLGAVTGSNTPRHQASARSSWNLPGGIELDAWCAFTSAADTPSVAAPEGRIPASARVGAHASWKAGERLRLSVGVRNLLDGGRVEFYPENQAAPNPVGHNVYGKAEWSF